MISKTDQIKQALKAGKTTREIAAELHVSLRDIGRVRKLLQVDIGAKERELEGLNRKLQALMNEIADKQAQRDRLIQEINALDEEIQRKRSYKKIMPVAVERIHIPVNASEVAAYLRKLDTNRLEWLVNTVSNILEERLYQRLSASIRGWS